MGTREYLEDQRRKQEAVRQSRDDWKQAAFELHHALSQALAETHHDRDCSCFLGKDCDCWRGPVRDAWRKYETKIPAKTQIQETEK